MFSPRPVTSKEREGITDCLPTVTPGELDCDFEASLVPETCLEFPPLPV